MLKQRLILVLLTGVLLGSVINANLAAPLSQQMHNGALSKSVSIDDLVQENMSSRSQTEEGTPRSAGAPKKWTVMVYLDADNNLESAGIDDLNEMEFVGSTTDVDIVVQMDRISGYDYSNGDWTGTRRFHVERDTSQSEIGPEVANLTETNMGAASSLKNFIEWAQTNYPAENYALILWDHGSGVMWGPYNGGIAWDDTSSQDYLTLSEIQTAITNKSIDLLGFDACLMASAEFFHGLSSYVSVLVGSEKTEPGDGWPYDTILGWLTTNPDATTSQLGNEIVDKYIASYASTDPVTQSAIEASYMSNVYDTTSILAGGSFCFNGYIKNCIINYSRCNVRI